MDRQTGGEADWPGREALHDLAACLRFYSRLPYRNCRASRTPTALRISPACPGCCRWPA